MWYITSTSISFEKRGGVLLQNTDISPLVLAFKLVPQDVPGTRGTWEAGKRALTLGCALQKTDVKYLCGLFCLTYQQLVPVNFRICPMLPLSLRRHKSCEYFYSSFQEGYPYYQPLAVRRTPAHSPLSHRIFRHPGPKCARLACHCDSSVKCRMEPVYIAMSYRYPIRTERSICQEYAKYCMMWIAILRWDEHNEYENEFCDG